MTNKDIAQSALNLRLKPVGIAEFIIVAFCSFIISYNLRPGFWYFNFGTIVPLLALILTYKRPRAFLLFLAGLLSASSGYLMMNAPEWPAEAENARLHKAKESLVVVAIALDKFRNEHGEYPSDFSELHGEYLPEMPQNVYTGKPMKEVRYGETESIGEFTYLPVITDGLAKDYYLIGYGRWEKIPGGPDPGKGMDVDGDGVGDNVIYVVDSRRGMWHWDQESSIAWSSAGDEGLNDREPMPPLADLLNAQKENPQAQSVATPENIK